MGVSRQTISSIETGQFNPTAKLALVLCIALDKKFEDLFYLTDSFEEGATSMEYFAVALFSIGVIGIPIAVLLYNDYGKKQGVRPGMRQPVEIVFFAIRTSILTNRSKSTKKRRLDKQTSLFIGASITCLIVFYQGAFLTCTFDFPLPPFHHSGCYIDFPHVP